jgi:holo-[acyl-carrier protein] synthase
MPPIPQILGTGIDIVETARVADTVQKFGDRFLNRCFYPDEIAYCQQMKFPAIHLAARFAAKEAISKAFGTGIGKQLGWRDMEICKKKSGEPFAVLHEKGLDLAKKRGVTQIFVSLTHSKDYAAASCVLIGNPALSADVSD